MGYRPGGVAVLAVLFIIEISSVLPYLPTSITGVV